MTQHDRISSYIDNELSGEQEQDFLISLASSDTLRKTFRSELILKNVIHRDEVLTEPSRDLRPAILGVIGIGAALATAETADAAPVASSGLKALFATKLNTLITASLVTVSALGGYAIRTAVAPEAPAPVQQVVRTSTQVPAPQSIEIQAPSSTTTSDLGSAPVKPTASKSIVRKTVQPSQTLSGATSPMINVGGSAPVNINTKHSK